MDPVVTAGIIGAGANVGGGLLNMIGRKKAEERAHDRNIQYMGIQNQNQMGLNTQQYGHQQGLNKEQYERQRLLNEQGQELQMKTWRETNYQAQLKMIKEAGLNPSLLYGMSGAGGSTTGSQGGGSAQGGSAQGGQAGGGGGAPMQPFDLGLQNVAKQMAEIELLKAQKNKTEKEADVIGNTGTREAEARIEHYKQLAKTEESKQTLNEIDGILKNTQKENIEEQIKLVGEQLRGEQLKNDLTEEQFDDLVELVGLELVAKQEGINLTKEQIKTEEEKQDLMQSEELLNQAKRAFQASKNMLAEFGINDYDDPLLRYAVMTATTIYGSEPSVEQLQKTLSTLTKLSYGAGLTQGRGGILRSVFGGSKRPRVVKGFGRM